MLEQFRSFRKKRYIQKLVDKGMVLGRDVYLNDGFFLDPSHCHLITIEDAVVFGPGVKLFAHDASTKKVLGKTRIGLVHLKRNCFLGAGTTVLPGVTVGENSIVGAASVVTESIPDNELWAGIPARRLMSVEDFRKRLLELPQIDFPSSTYASEPVGEREREEMRAALLAHGTGFITSGALQKKTVP